MPDLAQAQLHAARTGRWLIEGMVSWSAMAWGNGWALSSH